MSRHYWPGTAAPASPMKTPLAQYRAQRGIALLIVLWVVALISIIAGSFSYSVRSEITIVDNLKNNAQARSAAQAGIWLAIFQLQHPDPLERWPADNTLHELTFAGINLRIIIADEAGKLSLNYVNGPTLLRLLLGIGIENSAATALTDAILDWRDKDDLRRINGAEAEDYARAQIPITPRNGPFQSIDELRWVKGMNPEIYDRVKDLFTLQGKSTQLNPTRAGPRLREIMSGGGRETVANAANNSYDSEGIAATLREDATGSDSNPARPNTSTVKIHVEASLASGSQQQLSALVSLKPVGPGRRGSVLAWSENADNVFDQRGTSQ